MVFQKLTITLEIWIWSAVFLLNFSMHLLKDVVDILGRNLAGQFISLQIDSKPGIPYREIMANIAAYQNLDAFPNFKPDEVGD